MNIDFDKLVEDMEENEADVECKCCFDLQPKKICFKTPLGWLCPVCFQEYTSHEGNALDLLNATPEDIEYQDPRLPEKEEAEEVLDKPVDGNEIRKHENAIEEGAEMLDEHINDRPCDIEDESELKGMDNAVVDCQTDMKVIAHSEDEKPLDCNNEEPALEKPLTEDAEILEETGDKPDAAASPLTEYWWEDSDPMNQVDGEEEEEELDDVDWDDLDWPDIDEPRILSISEVEDFDEDYTGLPEIRTTHLEYEDKDPCDGEAVLPKNISED